MAVDCRSLPTVLVLALVVQLRNAAPAAADAPSDERSPRTALLWSLGGTGASLGVAALGLELGTPELALVGMSTLLVTPALGEIYAGQKFTAGMGVRLLGCAIGVGLVAAMAGADDPSPGDRWWLLAAPAVIAGGIAIDIVRAPAAARAWNQRNALRIAPTPLMTAEGPALGLGLSGRF